MKSADRQARDMHLLVTFDENYIPPFQTLLTSIRASNPNETLHIWLLHSAIPEARLAALTDWCAARQASLTAIAVSRDIFKDAPVSKRYPQEMYYRLLAPHLLPETVGRVLYLDPDILVINSLRPLWTLEMREQAFAAASHVDLSGIVTNVNRLRLSTEHDYFNTGVLLIDLDKARALVKPQEVFDCVRTLGKALLLPDQDLFNHLYGAHTLQVPDVLWNYDVRKYATYLLDSEKECDLAWVMQHTAILHFCSKRKPWKSGYTGRFYMLYKHYENLSTLL